MVDGSNKYWTLAPYHIIEKCTCKPRLMLFCCNFDSFSFLKLFYLYRVFRVICSTNSAMTQFFIAVETILFEFRFSCMNSIELCKLFRSLDHHIRSTRDNPDIYSESLTAVLVLFEEIRTPWKKWKYVIEEYLQGGAGYFSLPFNTVLTLVAKRQVVINRGRASVPVSKLRKVVTGFFKQMLEIEVKNCSRKFATDDERIVDLIRLIKVCVGTLVVYNNVLHKWYIIL